MTPAIITRFIAATRARKARVRAWAFGFAHLDVDAIECTLAAHADAALALCERKRWPLDLVGAPMGPGEMVWLHSDAIEARTVSDSHAAARVVPQKA